MTFYCSFPFKCFLEWRGCTRGHSWIDWVREDGDLLIWIGSLHAVLTIQPPVKKPMEGVRAVE